VPFLEVYHGAQTVLLLKNLISRLSNRAFRKRSPSSVSKKGTESDLFKMDHSGINHRHQLCDLAFAMPRSGCSQLL
jgi:hypothetical protein